MSTTLPEDAPVETPAVPSVEAPAPGVDDAVAEESVGSGAEPKTVPADRFNGLMRTFNQTQSELEATRKQLAELEARLNEQQSQTSKEPETTVSDTTSLEARIEQLSEMLVEERRTNALKDALNEYPEAKPFADLIVADTPDDVREMARLIAERAKAVNPAPTGETTEDSAPEAEAQEPPAQEQAPAEEPPVVGGGAAFSTEASTDDRVIEAIQRGSFADFVNAKWEKTALLGDGTNIG